MIASRGVPHVTNKGGNVTNSGEKHQIIVIFTKKSVIFVAKKKLLTSK